MRAIVPPDEGLYSYAGIGYANPHAVTSDSKWPLNNDLFLRSERQPRPKDHRRRNHNISLGLCKPAHCPRRWRRNHDLQIRCLRQPRLPSNCHDHDPLSVQVVLHRVIHGQRRYIRNHDRIRLQRRHARLHCRPAICERRSDRHRTDPLHPPRSSREHECHDKRKRDRRADPRLLPLRSDKGQRRR